MPLYNPPVPGTGAVFPTAPATNDRFLRTDRHIEYFYNGTNWLSAVPMDLVISMQDALNPLVASGAHRMANPWCGIWDIWVEQFFFDTNANNATAGNFFVAQLVLSPAAGGSVNFGTAQSSQNDTLGRWTTHLNQPAASITSTNVAINCTYTMTGTASNFISSGIIYRLIG